MQNIDVRQLSEFRWQVILEPLKRGFGHTLGNALRRVLLSSLPGCAPTEVVISGVKHQFSAIEGVQEDVINILLNLKGVRFTMNNVQDAEVKIKFTGPGMMTAANIQVPHNVEVLNPDHIIAHVNQAKVVEMDIRVQQGVGYVPAAQLQIDDELNHGRVGTLSGNVMYLDASFSPIRKVAYTVENARVEQRTDFDKLILDIETDGTILPIDAVRLASATLQEQLSVFSGMSLTQTATVGEAKTRSILDASVDELELTVRSANALKSENILLVRDLVALTEDELMALPNLGKKSLNEVREALENHQLNLADK